MAPSQAEEPSSDGRRANYNERTQLSSLNNQTDRLHCAAYNNQNVGLLYSVWQQKQTSHFTGLGYDAKG